MRKLSHYKFKLFYFGQNKTTISGEDCDSISDCFMPGSMPDSRHCSPSTSVKSSSFYFHLSAEEKYEAGERSRSKGKADWVVQAGVRADSLGNRISEI